MPCDGRDALWANTGWNCHYKHTQNIYTGTINTAHTHIHTHTHVHTCTQTHTYTGTINTHTGTINSHTKMHARPTCLHAHTCTYTGAINEHTPHRHTHTYIGTINTHTQTHKIPAIIKTFTPNFDQHEHVTKSPQTCIGLTHFKQSGVVNLYPWRVKCSGGAGKCDGQLWISISVSGSYCGHKITHWFVWGETER